MISDKNVRVAAASPAVRRRRARRSRLARLLLNQSSALLLLALLHPMFACVIPAAPDFQDPLSAVNSPPYLHDWSPPFGSTKSIISTPTSTQTVTFSTQVTDLNVQDKIFYRWVLNYPRATGTTTVEFLDTSDPAPSSGTDHTFLATFDMTCRKVMSDSITPGTPQHLTLIVADRAFADSPEYDAAPAGVFPQEIDWTLIFQCSAGTQ